MANSLGDALRGLALQVATSATFQARLAAADVAAAQQKIFYDAALIAEPLETLARLRPFALVIADEHGYEQFAEGLGIETGALGSLLIVLSDNVRGGLDHSASYLDFCDFCGGVLDDVAALNGSAYDAGTGPGSGAYFPWRSCELLHRPMRSPREEQTAGHDYWWAAYRFVWSVS